MPVMTIAAPLNVAPDEAHQVTIAAAGTPTANFITMVIPDGTTSAQIMAALRVARAACIRDPIRFRAH